MEAPWDLNKDERSYNTCVRTCFDNLYLEKGLTLLITIITLMLACYYSNLD